MNNNYRNTVSKFQLRKVQAHWYDLKIQILPIRRYLMFFPTQGYRLFADTTA